MKPFKRSLILLCAVFQLSLPSLSAEYLILENFEDGHFATNRQGTGSGWYWSTFNGGSLPVESGDAFYGSMGTEAGISAIQGRDVFEIWDDQGATVTWTIRSMTVNTPHKFNYFFAYCWEMGIVSANADRGAAAWNMSGPNQYGGFYIQIGKKDAGNLAELWISISNKDNTGEEGSSGFYTPTQTGTNPGGIGPVFTATFPIVVTAHFNRNGWTVSTNQEDLEVLSGNWTPSLQTDSKDASITDEFADGVFLFTAARNHGIDGSGDPFPENSGELDRITVIRGKEVDNLWDTGYQILDSGWQKLDWFGDYYPLSNGWIWHQLLGYSYVYSFSSVNDIFLFTLEMDWIWTETKIWPWVYRLRDQSWLWHDASSTHPRLFYNITQDVWETWP